MMHSHECAAEDVISSTNAGAGAGFVSGAAARTRLFNLVESSRNA